MLRVLKDSKFFTSQRELYSLSTPKNIFYNHSDIDAVRRLATNNFSQPTWQRLP